MDSGNRKASVRDDSMFKMDNLSFWAIRTWDLSLREQLFISFADPFVKMQQNAAEF